MYRCDTSLKNLGADELTDGCGSRCVVRGRKVLKNGSDDTGNDTAATSIAHAKSVGTKEHDRLKDLRGGEYEMANGVGELRSWLRCTRVYFSPIRV
jgi:hypothetical protein